MADRLESCQAQRPQNKKKGEKKEKKTIMTVAKGLMLVSFSCYEIHVIKTSYRYH